MDEEPVVAARRRSFTQWRIIIGASPLGSPANRRVAMKLLRTLITASALAFCVVQAQAATIALKADLKTSTEVPPHAGKGHGMVTAVYDTDSQQLSYHITFADLSGPATMAHFHGPAPAGANAKVQVAMPNPVTSPIDGISHLTAEQAHDLLGGLWYFNVHTAKNPGGEIRGQVVGAE